MTPLERLAAFQKFVSAKPDDPFTRYALAMHLRSMGREAEAVAEFRELSRRAPGYLPTWLMLGQTLEALGQGAEAAVAYRQGVDQATKQGNAHARCELEEALARAEAGIT
jgi:predicted Zn-dependent protease